MSLVLERPEANPAGLGDPCPTEAALPRRMSRWQRALLCLSTFAVAPFGWFLPQRFFTCTSEERLDQGLVLILPGIEGRSFLNMSILHGLMDADLPYAMEVVDWTTGNKFLTLYHLRSWRRNLRIAQQLAERIVEYQTEYPGRPVWIVGHSGGGGMALLTAQALPEGRRLTGLILLAAAVSPRFDLSRAMKKVERGIWNFHSWLDWFFVGLGTTVFGTLDGRHTPAAGMIGFREGRDQSRESRVKSPEPAEKGQESRVKSQEPATLDPALTSVSQPSTLNPQPTSSGSGLSTLDSRLIQTAYHPRMMGAFHWGGHFSCVHRVFVSEHVGPVMQAGKEATTEAVEGR